MTKQTSSWIGLGVMIGVLLGGAYLIVANNNPSLNASAEATPTGAFH
jgi:hypothetical protein